MDMMVKKEPSSLTRCKHCALLDGWQDSLQWFGTNSLQMLQVLDVFLFCKQGRRNVGRAGEGSEKKLRAMETYEKQKNRCQLSGP